jgi:sugar transferase EpsL
MYAKLGKRILDFVLALGAIIIILPVLVVLYCLVHWQFGQPVFFKQERPGFKGKVFRILKFRTMNNAKDMGGKILSDNERLTDFGRWLRSTSLDELPELINVLKGDMSLVGPRPLLAQYLNRYSHEQARRHDVKPGITGWAQINGRNALSWEEKFELDCWYVDNLSFWLDLRIMFLTFWKVVKREGISHTGEATMSEFMGNNEFSKLDFQDFEK